MSLRSVAAAAACIVSLLLVSQVPTRADGLPEPEDENYNPVPSKPGVPAPGVTQPPPIKDKKPKPAKAPKPAKTPAAPLSTPAPTPVPAVQPPVAAPVVAPPPETPVTTTPPATAPTPPSQPQPQPATPPTTPPPVQPAPPAAATSTPPATPAAPAATPVSAKKPIYEITGIEVQIAERQPPIGVITVKAVARTGGWKDIELKPLQTFAPEVGMRTFTLVGTPPTGVATQALSPVSAMIRIDPLPADVKTIRVLGESNEVAQTFR